MTKDRNMRIAVIGSNGMLGYAVSEYFKAEGYDVKCITRKEFDIFRDDIAKLEKLLDGIDVAINCAGVIKQKMGDYSIEEVLKVNAIFPINLAKLCEARYIKCFHITTDCVYSGKKGGYTESDYYDADDVYGMTKNAGDTDLCMTLRTSIIGEEKNSFKSLLEWVRSQKGKTVNGFMDHYWNGVTTLYFAEIIKDILEKGIYQKGIFHIYSKEIVSKYELVSMINDVYDLDITVNEYKTNSPCDRSLQSEKRLSDKLVTKSLRQQLLEMSLFFKNIKV